VGHVFEYSCVLGATALNIMIFRLISKTV